jgi:AcrR family transcriptional regulator
MKKEKQTTPSMSPAATVADDPGAALLNAARDIFVCEGVKGLSVRRVAESAGTTTMAVYSRFKGKDGILGALFDEGFDLLSQAQQSVDPELKDKARLVAFCNAYRAVAHAHPHHYALMLGHFSGELKPSPESQAKARATLDRLIDAVALTSSMKGKKRTACEEVANRLFAFCHGWVSLEQMGFMGDPPDTHRAFNKAVLALTTTS